MRKKTLLVAVMLFLGGVQAVQYQDSFKIHAGSSVDLDDYTFSYDQMTGTSNTFKVAREEGDTSLVLHQLEGDEIFDSEGHSFRVDSNLSYSIRDIDSDSNGLYLEIGVNSSRDVFASSDLDVDVPQKVFVAQGEELTVTVDLRNTGIVNQSFQLSSSTGN
ncbi:MAG: hypothetical protein ABEJ07_03145 [Candidatus Nanohaloarchaea archaeon]